MGATKRHLIFVSDNATVLILLGGAVSIQVGLDVHTCALDDYGHLDEALPEHKNVDVVVFFTEADLEAAKAEEIYSFWRKHFPDTDFLWCHGGINSGGDWNFREWVAMKGWAAKLLSIDTDLSDINGVYIYFMKNLNNRIDK